MPDETDTSPQKVSTDRTVAKKAANRTAAAKVYVAAMKKAGEEVPQGVKKLAKMADDTDYIPQRAPRAIVMSKKLANKIAAAKVYEAAMTKAGEEVPEAVRRLARRAS